MASGDAQKHELNEPWAVWEQREQGKNMSYGDKLFKLCTFSTVEEFWGYWNNIPSPSQVLFDGFTHKKFADRTVEGFAVFKDGIVPEWEDPENKNGGEWSIRKEVGAQELDEFWEKLVLGAIGELIDPGNEVTGVRVIHKNNKKDKNNLGNNYRYEIWLRGTSRVKADEIRNKTLDVVNSGSSGAPWVSNEKLLSPKRKLIYGLFAFGPGTVLGLYLYSVKQKMDRDNEALRLEQVETEMSLVQERQNKDLVLASAIQDMRDRLRRLEAEAITSRENAAKMRARARSKQLWRC
ncbi:uncharacterized protein PITG_02580 [Phytophthora infestans T30-4]|uniref:Eukaryotic translation initiation factor 4E n=1 Tax=Phytophthora infestans (strain T30-4) TaxID=403677 RepID=D0MWP7_PHYIT|nr:uncharacterized protein PITG_02580 [Phytophthora infestans T30-4]EEY64060.1 conserved hypothetical protein [Phytophthora infestans T30-4]|eukprot:XP_002907496.1 conserved hypothetical protein [Phytophthora infestans T30-4]